MISDNERREVAAKLRELPSDTCAALKEWVMEGLFIDASIGDEADYSQIHNAVFGCFPAEHMHPGDYEELHERLADLIDRPTCRNISGYQDVFTCSECRCKVEIVGDECSEYGECFCTPFMPSFCPSCGAEVMRTID